MNEGRNMTYEKALKQFAVWHMKALSNPYVKDKVAWALYQTWREADKSREFERKLP